MGNNSKRPGGSKPAFFYPELGDILKGKRKSLGLTQIQLLDEAFKKKGDFAVSPSTLRKYERGRISNVYNLSYKTGVMGGILDYFINDRKVLSEEELDKIGFEARMKKELGEGYFK